MCKNEIGKHDIFCIIAGSNKKLQSGPTVMDPWDNKSDQDKYFPLGAALISSIVAAAVLFKLVKIKWRNTISVKEILKKCNEILVKINMITKFHVKNYINLFLPPFIIVIYIFNSTRKLIILNVQWIILMHSIKMF